MSWLENFGVKKARSEFEEIGDEVQSLLDSVAENPGLVTPVQIQLGNLVEGSVDHGAGGPTLRMGDEKIYFDQVYMKNYRNKTLGENKALTGIIVKQIMFNR